MQNPAENHDSNIVSDVAAAGGCGLKNLTNGATCGLAAHRRTVRLYAPQAVPAALLDKGIDLTSPQVSTADGRRRQGPGMFA